MEQGKKNRVLDIQNLELQLPVEQKYYPVVQQLSIYVEEGEMVALVGESGCGKSMTAMASIGLQPAACKASGRIEAGGKNLLSCTEKEWETLRGSETAMIFQEPMTALNPLLTIGRQIAENAISHGVDKKEAKQRALEKMQMVGLPDVKRLYKSYPCQLSGGMRQRAMIAMALINTPRLLIADEPTTALDVTIQAQIMELLQDMNRRIHTAVLLISHDLGVVRNMCSRIYVMYAGHIVESGTTEEVFENPKHPYTRGLIQSVPDVTKRKEPLVSINGWVPSLAERRQEGCPFYERCGKRQDICKREKCGMQGEKIHQVACHLYTS